MKKKRKDKTKENWSSVLKHLKDYSRGKQIPFKRADEKWLTGFMDHLKSNVPSNNSIITYFTKVTTALNHAVKEKIILSNPASNVSKPKKEEVEISYLTKDELQLIADIEFDNNEVKLAFLFSCYTGLRISDIKKLKWSELQKQTFDGKTHTVINFRQKKTSERNYLPLSKQSMDLLKNQSKNNEFVFQLSKHSRSINKVLVRLMKKAGINKHITFHCARHTNATTLLSTGKVELFQVSRLLGHKDMRSTERYAKLTNAAKINAVNSFPEIEIK
jgi:integrase